MVCLRECLRQYMTQLLAEKKMQKKRITNRDITGDMSNGNIHVCRDVYATFVFIYKGICAVYMEVMKKSAILYILYVEIPSH